MTARAGWTRRLTCLGLLLAAAVLTTGTASAHPLGNFTINRYSRVDVRPEGVRIRYVLDLAEIPSVQEAPALNADAEAYTARKVEEIREHLELTLDGRPVDLAPTDVALSRPFGQADIPLIRLEMWFRATGPALELGQTSQHQATYRDRNDPARIGWREIVVSAGPGIALAESSVPAEDVTDELRTYPEDLLQSPLDQREARWTFGPGPSDSRASPGVSRAGAGRPTDAFANLITVRELDPRVVLLGLLGAAVLGGIHAASPGHGKSVMAAYIVGTRGTLTHALALALSVTVAHTAGVLGLALATLVAANLIVPDRVYPWLTLASGLLVLVVGVASLVRALNGRRHHAHHHDHPTLSVTWRGLFALGLAGGIVPSGSALVVLLSSVALGRLGFGLALVGAFGLGMAVVLVATGVLLVHAGRIVAHVLPSPGSSAHHHVGWLMPLAAAAVMTLLGVVATMQALGELGALAS